MPWKLNKITIILIFLTQLSDFVDYIDQIDCLGLVLFFHPMKISRITNGIKSWSDFHMEETNKIKSDKDKNCKSSDLEINTFKL